MSNHVVDHITTLLRSLGVHIYRIFEEADDAVDHLVEIGLHLLVGALGRRRERHQAGVSVAPIS